MNSNIRQLWDDDVAKWAKASAAIWEQEEREAATFRQKLKNLTYNQIARIMARCQGLGKRSK